MRHFLGREAVEGKIVAQLTSFVGADTAIQLQQIIKNASLAGKSTIAAVVGGIALIVGATTVFAEIQDSINMIWGLKPKPKRGWLKMASEQVIVFFSYHQPWFFITCFAWNNRYYRWV